MNSLAFAACWPSFRGMRRSALLLAALCAACKAASPGPSPAPARQAAQEAEPAAAADPLGPLIAEARRLVMAHGEAVAPGLAAAPGSVLLVQEAGETLYCHEGPAAGFSPRGRDKATGCHMFGRARSFPDTLKATFPAVDGVATVVIGPPKSVNETRAGWVMTLVHERFHQLQMSQPNYSDGALALDLHDGDATGMWMLTFPFPYEDEAAGAAFARLGVEAAKAARAALAGQGEAAALAAYLKARKAAQRTVSERDWRYVELQLWQEGTARYVEYAVAARAASARPDGALRPQLDFGALADNLLNAMERQLTTLDLGEQKRVAFYALGAAEALMIEAAWPEWREAYLAQPYALGPLLEFAAERAAAAE